MKNKETKTKKIYQKPKVTKVKIDNEISLVMDSPPATPIHFSNPIKFLFK